MTLRYVSSRELAKPKTYFLGVDLGQANDFTALCVLEREERDTGKRVPDVIAQINAGAPGGDYTKPVTENLFTARHLERLPIGTPYPVQVARIKALHDRLKAETGTAPLLVADATGVGAPVIDMLRAAELKPVAVTITGGDMVNRDGLDYRVPKRDLVSTVSVLLQAKRLKIAPALREAKTLVNELLAFKVSISLKGRDSYGNDVGPWRENPHDDLVLAVALACWYGEEYRPVVDNTPPSLSFRGSRYSGRR
jgi:hypothetical protein